MENLIVSKVSTKSRIQEWNLFLASLVEIKSSEKALIKNTENPSQLIYHLSLQFGK